MASPSDTNSTSVSAFLTTFIVNFVVFVVFIGLFILLRNRQKRVYTPRTIVKYNNPESLHPDEAPTGAFAWATHLIHKPRSFLIQQCGLDGYFFLRYIALFSLFCFLTSCLVWPLLFPLNATGGDTGTGFDILTMANVSKPNKYRLIAHALCSWIVFGGIIYTIYREMIYYISVRHAAQASPLLSTALSSRTILLTELPDDLMDETNLRELFPAASNIWYARSQKELAEKVKERTKLAKTYEGTLNKSIAKAVKIKAKADKKAEKGQKFEGEPNQVLTYLKKPPTHRLKMLIGKKVETLEYAPEHLQKLNEEIIESQSKYTAAKQLLSVFMEFPSELQLQKAYQAIPYHKQLKKGRRVIGVAPEDIIWANLDLSTSVRYIKHLVAIIVLCVLIIFWAIPVAVVGSISNINYLTEKVHFLRFILKMPHKLLGIITGLLPTVALAVLMSLLPPFIKFMGKFGGCLTVQEVEMWCHQWYYAFQVVQVFLVTTLASAATSVAVKIVDDPSSAMELLSNNLPKSSNFYIAYVMLQGLSVSSGALLQLVALILSHILGRVLDKTPRAMFNRASSLGSPGWGTIYPVYGLIAVIMMCYGIISPIILGFGAIGFFLFYIAYVYNLTYVMGHNKSDSRGRHYPLALFQVFVGLYLAEICLLGLFITSICVPAIVFEGILLGLTVAAHLYFKWIFLPLFDIVPVSALLNNGSAYPDYDQGLKEIKNEGKNYFTNGGNALGVGHSSPSEKDVESQDGLNGNPPPVVGSETNLRNPSPFADDTGSLPETEPQAPSEMTATMVGGGIEAAEKGSTTAAFSRFIHPRTTYTFEAARNMLPMVLNDYLTYKPEFLKTAYEDPAVYNDVPHIWVARDPLGLSATECAKAQAKNVDVTDNETVMDAQGKITWQGPPPDYEEAIRT
ncbi:hypothetical protein BABINDRAFT_36199 [Babjeviella inositovora NRRL Y-12698]|uniref:DUF221-domain-containing protein n=1 Tax=Babjeviella inositovora NRRL Y-12698 TaxID=984486 RepID=A0A1E3QQJ0_9ASCO|nr:uncharacterized protein BABINDRAFT_36199 [Babjeviella inositovora NRRL Y-12698]ODQ79949.1 hypothetical protein BABINDRAFT_36199 [Babjeviella inositovora NRRL Y-12698]